MQRDIYKLIKFREEQSLIIKEREGMEVKLDKFDIQQEEENIKKIKKEGKNIKYLEMYGNSYGTEYMSEFSLYLSRCEEISHVNLNNIFKSRLNVEIPKTLIHLFICFDPIKLQFIDLSHNAIAPNGCQSLSYFFSQAVNCKVLLMINCGIGYQGAQIMENALIQGGKQLQILALARNRMEDLGAEAIANAVKECKELKELHIFQNTIKQSMFNIFQALHYCQNINVIDVNDNHIDLKTAQELASLIKKSSDLRALNVNDCNMNEKCNELILEAFDSLGDQLKLQKLGYKYNELYGDQPQRLLNILIRNKDNLQRIDIQGNDFDNETEEYYLNVLKKNQIQRLVLSKFNSDDEDANYDNSFEAKKQQVKYDDLLCF